jgi:hypothetical protein
MGLIRFIRILRKLQQVWQSRSSRRALDLAPDSSPTCRSDDGALRILSADMAAWMARHRLTRQQRRVPMMHKIIIASTAAAVLAGAAVANAQNRYGNSDTVLPSFENWPHYRYGSQSVWWRSQCPGRLTRVSRGRRGSWPWR